MAGAIRLFYSFDEQDQRFCRSLEEQLRPMARQKKVEGWHAGLVSAGQDFMEQIRENLLQADIVLPLVSPSFLANDFCYSDQMRIAMMRHRQRTAKVLPIVVRPVHWADTPFESLQPLPSNREPVESWSNKDSAWLDVADGIRGALADLQQLRTTPIVPTFATEPIVPAPSNLGFDDEPGPDGLPPGWFNGLGYVWGASIDYEYLVLRRTGGPGSCLRLRALTDNQRRFGSLMQRFVGIRWAGRRVRLSGHIRTENLSGWAGLWLRADGEQTPNIYFYNMHDRPIRGTTPWTEYAIEAVLPTRTVWLNYGLLMYGGGQLWADDLDLQLI